MGRLAAQKLHEVISEGVRILLRQHPQLPLFVVFAIVSGETGDRSRLERIHFLVEEFPDHVGYTNGRIEYYNTLMRAADYNAMTSLYEPHGGAFEGSVVPIVRLVDGLACQVNALEPTGHGRAVNAIWHDPWELPSGLGFREPTTAAGYIHVYPGSGNQVHIIGHVHATNNWFGSDADARVKQIVASPPITQSGNTITVSAPNGDSDLFRNIAIDYDVTTPAPPH